MNLTAPLSSATCRGIVLTGFLTGSLLALLAYLKVESLWSGYLLILAIGFSSVLALITTRFRSSVPWLLSLSVLPFLALITGWLRWNFHEESVASFTVDVIPVMLFWLFLLIPFLQVLADKKEACCGAAVITALWRNSFTFVITALLTGLFWLILLFWSQLFSLIDIRFFEKLFFNNNFFLPIATATVIAASIALCRSLPAAGEVFRRFVTLSGSVILPLHALISLLFLAFLPFTGLAIIPNSVSATSLLTVMALAMMVMAAMVCSSHSYALRYPGWLQKLVMLAQWLAPLFALLACYALWLRVSQYGWTMERVNAAVVVAITLAWTLGNAWLQRRAWKQVSAHIDALSASVLGLMALLWLFLHTPVIDPYRITVNNQLSRLEQHLQQAESNDIWLFSHAGRRGHQALLMLQAHPEWLSQSATQQGTLAQMLTGDRRSETAAPDVAALREKITVRKGSPVPPESWWQKPDNDNPRSLQTCLYSSPACVVWMMDLNADGQSDVLLYHPTLRAIKIFAQEKNRWRQVGQFDLPEQSSGFDHAIEQGKVKSVEKPWRDLEVDGQRYPVHYYGMD